MSFVSAPGPSQKATAQSAIALPQPSTSRQIRFISIGGQPPRKRQRIIAACRSCRRRKVRCSGERPLCNTCVEHGQSCSGYDSDRYRQGNPSGNDDVNVSADESEPKSSGRDTSRGAEPCLSASAHPSFSKPGDSDDGLGTASSARISKAGSVTSTYHRAIPYFRYFGPTAIVPGFKQMVVQLREHRRSTDSVAAASPSSVAIDKASSRSGRPPVDIPFYDATHPSPNAPLITHLCETFFIHLGCNYPFLQRKRFMRDLLEKKVDAMLVDAVCGVAARFSSDSLLAIPSHGSVPVDANGSVKKQFRGHAFIQRAMSSIVETFACPTIAVAQACLLLAYDEFGSDHDSGLWMYLGTSIRMAQDLGIQKLEGLQLEGRVGPTPRSSKGCHAGKELEARREVEQLALTESFAGSDAQLLEDRRASEQERINTFFAILFLDRTVSSGVGRPVTLRDKDIEISFPPYRQDDETLEGWPHPFPPMIRIVHMYGRVADVLNNLKHIDQVTTDVLKRLAELEKDLTGMYQCLSPRLQFNPTNFQQYVKAQQGTNFILLHFWFHTLIILLHQPTLLHSFEGRMQQLFPGSRELAMSSAKTIADIIAFAELIDVKSIVGNPFTSQPMYIAARAFLAEAAIHASQPVSRGSSPPTQEENGLTKKRNEINGRPKANKSGKSSLLHSAANTNYQRCYKALQILESYWAGCRYILTALDQMSTGLMDPLLFTSEDVEEMPSTAPSFTTPGWRRSTTHRASMGVRAESPTRRLQHWDEAKAAGILDSWSPGIESSQAIGWSVTGGVDTFAPNVSFLYQNLDGDTSSTHPSATTNTAQAARPSRYALDGWHPPQASQGPDQTMLPPILATDTPSTDADLLLSMSSEYVPKNSSHAFQQSQSQPYAQGHIAHIQTDNINNSLNFADLPFISHDVDMSISNNFAFPGVEDVIPWLEYLPQDVLDYFGEPHGNGNGPEPAGV